MASIVVTAVINSGSTAVVVATVVLWQYCLQYLITVQSVVALIAALGGSGRDSSDSSGEGERSWTQWLWSQ